MNLEEFYKNVVYNNEHEISGWSTCYYGVWSKIINEYNYKNVAEVGIGYGLHAKNILKTTNVEKLYLIDPTKFYPNDGFAEDIMKCKSKNGDNFHELFELINKELNPWVDRYFWYRKNSLDITKEEIPDESLDSVFIDGDHSYDAVKNDLTFWWEKIKKGGQMLGDDYWMLDVARAVDEFSNNKNIKIDFLYKPNTNYKIYRFFK
jgi:hypothetical protein